MPGAMPGKRGDETPFDRHFRVLETVAAYPRGLGLTEIATILTLPKSTAHRMLRTLTASGLLACRNTRAGPYLPGDRLLRLIRSSMPDAAVERVFQPLLGEMVEKTGDTCFVARLSGHAIRSVAMATPQNDVHVYVVPGSHLSPRHAASAKAILAFQDKALLEKVLAGSDAPTAPSASVSEQFEAELAAVRSSETAYNAGEDIAGYAAVASPVHSVGLGVQYSVAVTGTSDRLMADGRSEFLARTTRQFAARIAAALEIRLSQSS